MKFILNDKKYDTKKMRYLCSSICFDIYLANDGRFVEVETFWGIPMRNVRFISDSLARRRVGEHGKWETYEEVWGKVPED